MRGELISLPLSAPVGGPLGSRNIGELCEQVRASVLRSLVARQCLSEESAAIMKSWPIERSGFSVFVGDPLTLPENQADVKRVLANVDQTHWTGKPITITSNE